MLLKRKICFGHDDDKLRARNTEKSQLSLITPHPGLKNKLITHTFFQLNWVAYLNSWGSGLFRTGLKSVRVNRESFQLLLKVGR